MPSKSAKQHRFMEAIAHSPSFAKKAGVPQSVGKDFAAADKGKKFVAGGINKQNTRHGKMDMPFNKLTRFAGMKSGGVMKKKVRKFDKGGFTQQEKDWLGEADSSDPHILSRMRSSIRAKAPVEDRSLEESKMTARIPIVLPSRDKQDVDENAEVAPAVEQQRKYLQGRADAATTEREFVPGGTDEYDGKPVRQTANRSPVTRPARAATTKPDDKLLADLARASAAKPAAKPADRPAAAPARAPRVEEMTRREREAVEPSKLSRFLDSMRKKLTESSSTPDSTPAATRTRGQRLDDMTRSEREAVVPSRLSRATGIFGMKAGGMTKGVDKKLPTSKKMGNLGMKHGGKTFAQGGMMKESKAMVGKEVEFMKKKGAPKSMIKHEAAEMGAMKKGGMAKYARGGGIESKGKTKGTMIKMAAGGVVKFARGGGIESRGKTKGTMIKMNKGGYC